MDLLSLFYLSFIIINHFSNFYPVLMRFCGKMLPVLICTSPVTHYTCPVMISNYPVLANNASLRMTLYRYQLMFLYGSACLLVDDTKYFLQLENLSSILWRGWDHSSFRTSGGKRMENYYWREASSAKRTLKWFSSHGYISEERHLFQTYLEQV